MAASADLMWAAEPLSELDKWQSALRPIGSSSGGGRRDNHDVVLVAQRGPVEPAAAGDEQELWGCAEEEIRGQPSGLRVGAPRRDPVIHLRIADGSHRNDVRGLQHGEPEERAES